MSPSAARAETDADRNINSHTLAAVLILALAVAMAISVNINSWRAHLTKLHDAEALYDAADEKWQGAVHSEDAVGVAGVVTAYEEALALLEALKPIGGAGLAADFAFWLGQPLRLRVLHRIAAGKELLRHDPAGIARAHAALLTEGYCDAVLAEMEPAEASRTRYAACIAPHARGTILFAASPSDADAAFEAARRLHSPGSGGPVLSWTTRWQLPDRHTAGLSAHPWWDEHPAVRLLEASFTALLNEYDKLARIDTGSFARRRADSWIAKPKDGWAMLPLEGGSVSAEDAQARCAAAKATCALLSALRVGGAESGVQPVVHEPARAAAGGAGYYKLKPGTRLQPHAGPTNERLTCHLTLRGDGAWFTVGNTPAREWQPGRAFCFDDSFVHEARHSGREERVVLLVDVPHPDLHV